MLTYKINPMPNDLYQIEKLFYKSIHSYKGFIPSTDFNEYEYSLYLQYASAGELENDILSEKTFLKMVYDGGMVK